MPEYNCKSLVSTVLKRGGRWRNKQIENEILRLFNIQYQSNTIAKNLFYLKNDGKVLSAPVGMNGSTCFEYWWIGKPKKKLNSDLEK